jgi:dihydroorotate dehydrogenase electron transfer subunit
MNNFKAEIIEIYKAAKDIFKFKMKAPELTGEAKPGQFVEVLCQGRGAPFLRRPFGIHRVDRQSGTFEILFKKVGRGTELLSNLQAGDILDINGPLGKGFELSKSRNHIIAGGGMGIAPLLFLAQQLHSAGESVKIVLAAKNADEVLCKDAFKQYGEVFISTEDGSAGEKCLIDTPLERLLKNTTNNIVYACGPHAMLKCVAGLGTAYKTETQVSLEEKMACGLGVCQGCPVEVKNKDTKYKMVCKEGPVFNAEDIVW